MVKRFFAIATLCLSLCLVSAMTVPAETEWDPDFMVTLLQSAMQDTWDGYDMDLSVYNENTIRMKIGMKSVGTKDFAVSNKSEVAEVWDKTKESWAKLSGSAYGVFESLGYTDKFFTVCVMDDIYDESSDVWFLAVNGNIVYDLYY